MLWKDARSRYARIPSADASRFSYDLVEIPPVYIDKPDGGIRKQIFSSLKEDDTDWTPIDGDIALKDQFSVIDLNLGEGGMDSKSVFGKTSFSKVISQTISGEAEFAGVVKPEGSYGFSEGTEESWEENSVYTYARRTAEVYGIELVPDNIDFTKEFIKAVKNLPSTNVNGENDEVYKDFIRAWGTHYPEKVVYGGYFMAVMTESFKEHMEKETSTEEWAAAVVVDGTAEASVGTDEASVSKTIGYKGKLGYESSSKESKEITIGSETSTYSFQYRGGQGSSSENYTIGDDVVPVGIELKRLEGLFDQKYFEEEIPNLNKKAKILGDLISGHLEYAERIDTRKQMSGFEIYELYDVSLEVISCDDSGSEMELYGSIEIGNGDFITVFQKSGIGADKEWIDVKCEGETFKVKDKGGTGEIRRIYITPDKNGSTEKSLNQKFSIRYQFSEHDEGGREEHDILSELKYHHKTITDLRNELKNQGKDEIEYSHKIKRDGFVDMNIKYKIKKIPLGLNESNVQVNN